MSIIDVQITEDKIRGFKVNLPNLRVSTWNLMIVLFFF
jgi:hypothetical protein